MAVIGVEVDTRAARLIGEADSATAVLRREQVVVVLGGEAVRPPQVTPTLSLCLALRLPAPTCSPSTIQLYRRTLQIVGCAGKEVRVVIEPTNTNVAG